jgi:hypothetical protein
MDFPEILILFEYAIPLALLTMEGPVLISELVGPVVPKRSLSPRN